MTQIAQIAAAILILLAFFAVQAGRMSTQSFLYLTVNLIGSAVLTAIALVNSQWGFVLLESGWAAVSYWGLARAFRARSALTP